jgi:hypothetical protein
LEILKCLEGSNIVNKYDVLVFELFEGGFYIKIRASFHWQNKVGRLVMRWDNAGHHKGIETYPHHLHRGDTILPSYHISCDEILKDIESKISG